MNSHILGLFRVGFLVVRAVIVVHIVGPVVFVILVIVPARLTDLFVFLFPSCCSD